MGYKVGDIVKVASPNHGNNEYFKRGAVGKIIGISISDMDGTVLYNVDFKYGEFLTASGFTDWYLEEQEFELSSIEELNELLDMQKSLILK